MPLQVLRSCCFPFKYPTHGGIHRSEQIHEILLSHNVAVTDLDQIVLQHRKPLQSRIVGAFDSLRKQDWNAFCSSRLGSIGQTYTKYEQALNTQQYDALIWETVGESMTPSVGKKYSLPVIALPHNLEAFFKVIMQQRQPSQIFPYLKQEINTLKQAEAVFAISVEEQMIFRNFGIEADYLPYYPPQRLVDFYTNIRNQRKAIIPTHFLILGSVNNQLNWEGVCELMEWLDHIAGSDHPKILLAGNHTESLKGKLNYPWLKICGTVTQEELKQLLLQAKAVLIHQKRGLGVLTRIPEMLIAGIPVIANRIAARSISHLPGVLTYSCCDELQGCLNQDLFTPPLPRPPERAISRLLKSLSNGFSDSH